MNIFVLFTYQSIFINFQTILFKKYIFLLETFSSLQNSEYSWNLIK